MGIAAIPYNWVSSLEREVPDGSCRDVSRLALREGCTVQVINFYVASELYFYFFSASDDGEVRQFSVGESMIDAAISQAYASTVALRQLHRQSIS